MGSAFGKANRRLVGICVFFALGSFLWGYDIGILASIYVNSGWIKALNKPSVQKKGLITSIYYLGTWIGYVFISGRVSDRIGRRYAALCGACVTCIGASVMTGAHGKHGLAMMVIARIISGFGNSLISTSVPMYQSEIAPAKKRGGLVVMNHIGMIGGLATAFWVGYAVSHWTTKVGIYNGWRMSVALQFIPALIFVIGLPFVPETPRWLLEKGRTDEAQKSLQFFRGEDDNPAAVAAELAEIKENIDAHNSVSQASWHSLVTDKGMFQRLWRAAVLQFMAQTCGATAIKYYLPTVFTMLGLSKDLSLMAGGIESTLKIGCTIIEMLIIDRVGRRGTLLIGSALMSLSMLMNGALPLAYPGNLNRASDYACVVFIFFFSFGYSIGFGPNAWVYGAEIFPTHARAKALNVCASAGSIGSIVINVFFPVAIQNIGPKTYFIFFSINFTSLIIIAIFYPETKGKTLEEMDKLFDKSISDSESGSPIRAPTKMQDEPELDAEQQTVLASGRN